MGWLRNEVIRGLRWAESGWENRKRPEMGAQRGRNARMKSAECSLEAPGSAECSTNQG